MFDFKIIRLSETVHIIHILLGKNTRESHVFRFHSERLQERLYHVTLKIKSEEVVIEEKHFKSNSHTQLPNSPPQLYRSEFRLK